MIPNVIHFIFGLRPDFGGKPFSYVHFLSVISAWQVNRPDAMYLHYAYEPTGEWWDKARIYLTPRKIEAPSEVFGNPLEHFAHKADVVRLEVLQAYGGIYLDLDVVCVNSLEPLRHHECVMGMERRLGLCNAVIMAARDSRFINAWRQEYRTFSGDEWNFHSVVLPYAMAQRTPDWIHVDGPNAFYYPLYNDPAHLLLWGKRVGYRLMYRTVRDNARLIWAGLSGKADLMLIRPQFHVVFGKSWHYRTLEKSYCVHLWEKLWWDKYLRDLTPSALRASQGNFARLAREKLQLL